MTILRSGPPVQIHQGLLTQAAQIVVPNMMSGLFRSGVRSHGFANSLGFAFAFAGVLSEDADEASQSIVQAAFSLTFIHDESSSSDGDPMTIQEWVEKCTQYAEDKLKLSVREGMEGRILHSTMAHLLRDGDLIYVGSAIELDMYGAGSGGPNHWDEVLTRMILQTYWGLNMAKMNVAKAMIAEEKREPYMPENYRG